MLFCGKLLSNDRLLRDVLEGRLQTDDCEEVE